MEVHLSDVTETMGDDINTKTKTNITWTRPTKSTNYLSKHGQTAAATTNSE